MKLKTIRHLWGVDEAWETLFPKLKSLGYAGVECPIPPPEQRARFGQLLAEHELEYVAMVFSAGWTPGRPVNEHVDSLRTQLREAKELKPLFANGQTGADRWSLEECVRFFDAALNLEADLGIQLCHETHRSRSLFNPWRTNEVLDALPSLKLCADYSHWVCVAERLIDSELDILERCAEQTIHIHARVGHECGPQVPDPRAPEYARHLEAHERWWDLIWDSQHRRGATSTTLTPEFGPPTYMPTLPYTNVPVANLWDICNWQAKRQAERFNARHFGG